MLLQILVSGFFLGGIYALMACGLSLILGVMRIVNLTHGCFFTLGAYILFSFILRANVNPFIGMFFTIIVLFFIGSILEWLIIKRIKYSEINMMVLTLALAIAGEEFIRIAWGPKYLHIPPLIEGEFRLGHIYMSNQRILACFIGLFMLFLLMLFLKKTKTGKAIRMVQQIPETAALMGINVRTISMVVFGLGVVLAGAAGSLWAPMYIIYPAMGWTPLLISFAIVILGGMGSLGGSILGGFLFGFATLLTSMYISSGLVNVIPFITLFIVLLIRPTGFFGKDIF